MGLYTSLKMGSPKGKKELLGDRPYTGDFGEDVFWPGIEAAGSGLIDLFNLQPAIQEARAEQQGPTPDEILEMINRARTEEAGLRGAVPGGPGLPPPDPQPQIPDLLTRPHEYGMMGERKGYTPPVPDTGAGETAGAATGLMGVDQQPTPEAPAGGMSPQQRALLLRTLSGLTEAGREMRATPTLADIRHGAGTMRPFQPETELKGAAKEIEAEEKVKRVTEEAKQKAIEEGLTDPLVQLYNEQYARPRGLPEVQTRQEAVTNLEAVKLGAGIEKTEAETAALEGRAVAAAQKAAKGEPLSDKQLNELTQIDTTIKSLERLLVEKPEFNTGPITNSVETVMAFIGAAEFAGWDKSDKLAFKSDVADMLAQYMKSISGVAISAKEAQRLKEAFPKPTDDDKTFMKKGKAAIKRLLNRRTVFLDNLEKQGKDVSTLRQMSEGETAGKAAGVYVRNKATGKKNGPWTPEEAQELIDAGVAEPL